MFSNRALALYEDEVAQLGLAEPWSTSPMSSLTPVPSPSGQEAIIPAGFMEEESTKECQICLDAKHTDLYPQTTGASDCRCLSDACLACLQEHIKTQMRSKEWNEESITCPVCNRPLNFQEIEEFADGKTFSR